MTDYQENLSHHTFIPEPQWFLIDNTAVKEMTWEKESDG
jgi:hypothetical protein